MATAASASSSSSRRRRVHHQVCVVLSPSSLPLPQPCRYMQRCRFRATCSFHHGTPVACDCTDVACPCGHTARTRPGARKTPSQTKATRHAAELGAQAQTQTSPPAQPTAAATLPGMDEAASTRGFKYKRTVLPQFLRTAEGVAAAQLRLATRREARRAAAVAAAATSQTASKRRQAEEEGRNTRPDEAASQSAAAEKTREWRRDLGGASAPRSSFFRAWKAAPVRPRPETPHAVITRCHSVHAPILSGIVSGMCLGLCLWHSCAQTQASSRLRAMQRTRQELGEQPPLPPPPPPPQPHSTHAPNPDAAPVAFVPNAMAPVFTPSWA
jgi:hypothetical protein